MIYPDDYPDHYPLKVWVHLVPQWGKGILIIKDTRAENLPFVGPLNEMQYVGVCSCTPHRHGSIATPIHVAQAGPNVVGARLCIQCRGTTSHLSAVRINKATGIKLEVDMGELDRLLKMEW